MKLKVSVVIPALNESSGIIHTLQNLRDIPEISEIIVVDGGSTDNTVEIASTYAKVISAQRGRACQMNEGARAATGQIILFLHADSIITSDSIREIGQAVFQEQVVGGCLKLKFDEDTMIFKAIAFGSNLRSKLLKLFFGDQGIFVRRDVFNSIEGFPDVPIMEDWQFCRRLKTAGKIKQLKSPVVTSSRRFRKHGIWKTLFLMHKIKLLYVFGVNPTELKHIYSDDN